jgi:hypothetical protein
LLTATILETVLRKELRTKDHVCEAVKGRRGDVRRAVTRLEADGRLHKVGGYRVRVEASG